MIQPDSRIAVIGLGYVGLPLAVAFSKKRQVIGFDINESRVSELIKGEDTSFEVPASELSSNKNLTFSSREAELKDSDIYIVTVPTPTNENNTPNLEPLLSASSIVGKNLKSGNFVIYESTVYPGATETECVPVLEKSSGLKLNQDFYVGYSPERINPGDSSLKLSDITKVTSGSCELAAINVDNLYKEIITAGTYKAENISVAEACKVIENIQRDVNIALMNELSLIFKRLDINLESVLEAAETKWNFLKFRPGLVGGHCIGVDPYYLIYQSQVNGYNPELISASRRINEKMGPYVANSLIKIMAKSNISVKDSKVLIMGLTFKENCPDLRNTKVKDIINELINFGSSVDILDPFVSNSENHDLFGASLVETPKDDFYDAIIIAVAHDQFKEMGSKKIKKYGKENHILLDLKHILSAEESDFRL